MRQYLIRRLLLVVVTLFMVSILVFLSIRLIPGNIVDSLIAEIQRSSGTSVGVLDREALERLWGIDVPVHVQYGRWMGVLPRPDPVTGENSYSGIFQGSLGTSLKLGAPVTEMILRRVAVTFELGLMAIVIACLIALPVGIYSAIRQDTVGDYVGRFIAIIGLSTPNFWLAMMVMLYPALYLGWSPPVVLIPFTQDPLGNLGQFIIPAAILGTSLSAMIIADDPHNDAGGAEAGLHQDRLVKGPQGEGSGHEARAEERPDSCGDHSGSYLAHYDRRRGNYGEYICPAWDGAPHDKLAAAKRLYCRLWR